MSEPLPDPLVLAEVDLRDFPYLPVMIARLFGSAFHAKANDAEWRAGFTLWLKSWHQQPAASIPDDDVELTRLAELGRDIKTWRKVKAMALHGWVRCSDGRLYHPVVAEQAIEAWRRKVAQRDRTQKARDARNRGSDTQHAPPVKSSVTETVTDPVTASKGREGKGGEKQELALRLDRLVAVARIDATKHPVHAGPISAWEAMGCEFEADILATVANIAQRPNYTPPRGLEYFNKAVLEARDKRLASGSGGVSPAELARLQAEAAEHAKRIARAAETAN
ncbi:MAG TPA: DUF1376 domain-containing protein [Ramlibacter sp.]|nr:DUF1376 domain-containing protein [Ramlibacter sp.]